MPDQYVALATYKCALCSFVAWGVGDNYLSNCWDFCFAISAYVDWGLTVFGEGDMAQDEA